MISPFSRGLLRVSRVRRLKNRPGNPPRGGKGPSPVVRCPETLPAVSESPRPGAALRLPGAKVSKASSRPDVG